MPADIAGFRVEETEKYIYLSDEFRKVALTDEEAEQLAFQLTAMVRFRRRSTGNKKIKKDETAIKHPKREYSRWDHSSFGGTETLEGNHDHVDYF